MNQLKHACATQAPERSLSLQCLPVAAAQVDPQQRVIHYNERFAVLFFDQREFDQHALSGLIPVQAGSADPTDYYHPDSGHYYRIARCATDDLTELETILVQDLTDVHRSLRQQQLLQHDLLNTSRSLSVGELATTLAHELNQPIGAIHNYLRSANTLLARHSHTLPERVPQAITRALNQAEHASGIIRGVREFVARREPNRVRCDLSRLVLQVFERMQWDLLEAHIQVSLDLPSQPVEVLADAVMIEQVIANLVRNASDAMRSCEPNLRELKLRVWQDADRAAGVAVTDSGHGLTDDQARDLFTPFFSTKADGMGIGLCICRSILELHQGTLTFEPLARGTCFSFAMKRV